LGQKFDIDSIDLLEDISTKKYSLDEIMKQESLFNAQNELLVFIKAEQTDDEIAL
jgi:homogentisate 1,2-dioxygenase